MKCNNCGKELKDGDKYCGYCGTPTRERPPKKKHKILIIVLILCVILATIIGIVVFMNREKLDENSVAYPDGDIVYHPQEENIKWDRKECVLYYDNLVTVYLMEHLSTREENKIADQISGKIVTRIHGAVQAIQIKVEPTNLKTLNTYISKLNKDEKVMDALYDTPHFVEIDALDENPWSSNGKVIKDKNKMPPSGNDWWAEAVNAYDAWAYVDEHTDKLSKVTVGIIDNGFDVDHEDLKDESKEIAALPGYEKNSEADHGTHVMGLIAANNNKVGIRGIADRADISYVDWTPNTENDKDENYISLLGTGEHIHFMEEMMKNGYIINCSFGASQSFSAKSQYKSSEFYKIISKKIYKTDEFQDELEISYDEYCKTFQKNCDNEALQTIDIITNCLLDGGDDFIIVQSAGNGNSLKVAVDAKLSGTYASISEEVYNKRLKKLDLKAKHLKDEGITYKKIKDHIMIVGSVRKAEEDAYKMTNYSNYGKTVDICAPGGTENVKIYSTVVEKGNKKYGKLKGTSMATPIVSGAVALLWQIDPDLTAGEVKNILIETAGEAKPSSKNDTRESYPMLNVGNAVQKAATAKALRDSKWRIESNGTKVYSFQKNGIVFDVTKKEYGFSDEAEDIGRYENKNGIIEFEIEGKKRQFQYGKMSSIKDSVLVSDDNNWFNEDLFEKYKNEDIFYEINPEDVQYPIIMMPFQDEVKKADPKIEEKLISSYWGYMGADSILEEFREDGSVKQYAWEITGDGADIGQYKVSDDTLLFLQNNRLWRLKYVKAESIKGELERIFGENLSWLPEYIFYETDNVLQYPFDSDIGSCPSYLLPADSKQTDWKEAYRNVIQQNEEEYGPYELHSNNNIQYAGGLCYLELKDIDKDGIAELYMVHNANVMNEEKSYEYEVWTYKKGKAVQLETGGLCYSNGGWPSVVWTMYQGKTYLISSDGLSYWLHGFKDDGSFGVAYTYKRTSVDSSTETFINGKSVDLDQWSEEVNMHLKNGTSTSLYYTEGDNVYKQVEEVKKEVGL